MLLRNVAILVDGSFFLRRATSLGHHSESDTPEQAVSCLRSVIENHLKALDRRYGVSIPPKNNQESRRYLKWPEHQLYRVFYYEAPPYTGRATKPISRETINYNNTDSAIFRRSLFKVLQKERGFALRMGKLSAKGNWLLDQKKQKQLLRKEITVDDLTDDDFVFEIKQKGVDMRIGLDIASLTLKKQIQTIVLISGDSDFVSAAKLARREGVEVILDPLRNNVSEDLFEHIDGLRHGLMRKNDNPVDNNEEREGELE